MSEEQIVGSFTEIDLETVLAQMPLLVELKMHFSTLVTPLRYTTATTRYDHSSRTDMQSVQVVVLNGNEVMCRISLGTGSNWAIIYVSSRPGYYNRVKAHILEFLKTAKIHVDLVKIPTEVSF